ncbi:MAG: prolipoprotein diacylglyceryl transferase [Candidatus Rokubacteria bacterium]|nr:prolipoprotein diacylglyceryl transferase [Candidatus Rokubacteria bacterium]
MYPVLLDLGFYELRSYGVFVAIAIVAGIWFSARGARLKGLDPSAITDASWPIVVAGLVGARLYYIAFSEPAYYLAHPFEILAVWHGGLSVHGALLGGLAAALWDIRRRGVRFWRFADAVAPGLILGQTVGQIACLLNGDTYGRPTTLPWAITFTDPRAMAPLGVPLHPIQIYELFAYLAVFLVVWQVSRHAKQDGAVILSYAVAYGVVRFAMEFFRGDPPVVAGIIVPQAMSVLLLAGALVAWLSMFAPLAVPRRRAAEVAGPVARDPASFVRKGLLLLLPIGAGAVAVGSLSALRSPRDRGYHAVARWRIPGGAGRFIAVGPEPTPDELRALGEQLREEFQPLNNAVVMIFDDAEAARQARRGSRIIGEERYQAALAHQRAMYVKQAARGEDSLVIYDRYPSAREVIRY